MEAVVVQANNYANHNAAKSKCNGVYTQRTYGVYIENILGTSNTGGEVATRNRPFPTNVTIQNTLFLETTICNDEGSTKVAKRGAQKADDGKPNE
mmetsp:Transcript_7348/g.12849  ORF Transcript_7348/g.12849 Transcript_7348/m.12849 type:complete len:95 (-) Transcript_7348:2050-2334(-)